MQMTSVSTAVVLMYMAPIYVTVFSVLFFGERLTKRKLVSVACMLVGCCLVSGIIGGLKFDATGMLIGLLSGVAYASYSILTKLSMRRGVDPITATLYGFLFMSLISLFVLEPASLVTGICLAPARTLPLLLGLGICTFVVPYFLYTLAIRDLSAGVASSLGIIEPMFATLLSVTLFQEPMDLLSALGIALILGATYMIGRAEGVAARTENEDETKAPKS
jgi:drug/metabolite transporter (DMT)-like permease